MYHGESRVSHINCFLSILHPSMPKVNKGLHWSLCVVVNPGAITTHLTNIKNYQGPLDDNLLDTPFPCLLFLDALKMHNMKTVGKHIRKWLNAEWARLNPNEAVENFTPFSPSTMLMTSPQVPRQTNSFDCGVFVCRYGYGLLRIRSRTFSYRQAGITELTKEILRSHRPLFPECITDDEVFNFDMDDIHRIREELKELITRLSKIYVPIQQSRDRKEKEERLARKRAKRQAPGEEYKENTNAQTKTSNSCTEVAAVADSDDSTPSVGATANAIATLAISQPADPPSQWSDASPMDIESEASMNATATKTSGMAVLEVNRASPTDAMRVDEEKVQEVSKLPLANSMESNDGDPLGRPSDQRLPIPCSFTDDGLDNNLDGEYEDL